MQDPSAAPDFMFMGVHIHLMATLIAWRAALSSHTSGHCSKPAACTCTSTHNNVVARNTLVAVHTTFVCLSLACHNTHPPTLGWHPPNPHCPTTIASSTLPTPTHHRSYPIACSQHPVAPAVEGTGQNTQPLGALRHWQLQLQPLLLQPLLCQLGGFCDRAEQASLELSCCLVGECDHHDALRTHTL